MSTKPKSTQPSMFMQLLVSFVIPLVILTKFSGQSQLGATKGFLLALAFPVAYELYNVYTRKKISLVSVIAIGGILVTGLIGLLGLNESWLALRRGIPYLFGAGVVAGSIWIKKPIVPILLSRMLNMDKVHAEIKTKEDKAALESTIRAAGYQLSYLLLAVAVASYVLTRVIINAEAGTEVFNQEYAKLRVVSLPAISLPFLIAFVVIIMILVNKLEKLTGLDGEHLLQKKKK